MISSEIASQLNFEDNGSKIVLFVIDGLGGLPLTEGGLTELETAKTPNLDKLAAKGITGMTVPIAPGSVKAATSLSRRDSIAAVSLRRFG